LRALLAVALLPAIAAAQKSATVEQIRVRGNGDAMEVEIQTSGATVAPNTQALSGPNRIVVDFPGALPSAALRGIEVNRGNLKAIRASLFFKNPPITRIVLDLDGAQPYRIATEGSAVVVKLAGAVAGAKPSAPAAIAGNARLRDVALVATPGAPQAKLTAVSTTAGVAASAGIVTAAPGTANPGSQAAASDPAVSDAAATAVLPAEPPKPVVTVSYDNGMLRIHAEKGTLSQVLYEVQTKTGAEIGIPAGAEQEKVVGDFGPGPAREVLGSLLNGSAYNFIFVGNELALEKVILTRRQNVF